MNILTKPIKIQVNDKEFDFVLDMDAAINFQDLAGVNILVGIDKVTQNQDLKMLAYLMATCLKYNGSAVGLDFVSKLDLMGAIDLFMPKLAELMMNSLPQEDGESTEKKTEKEIVN